MSPLAVAREPTKSTTEEKRTGFIDELPLAACQDDEHGFNPAIFCLSKLTVCKAWDLNATKNKTLS